MPQFDFSTYSAQIFWFAICFAFLYFFMSKTILPRLRSIIEGRKEVIDGDLNFAKSLEESIDNLRDKTDDVLREANIKHKIALDEVVKISVAKREKALEEFKEKAEKSMKNSKEEVEKLVKNSQEKNKKTVEELVALIEQKFIN